MMIPIPMPHCPVGTHAHRTAPVERNGCTNTAFSFPSTLCAKHGKETGRSF